MQLEGIHHVTCITGDAPGNVDFYTRVLGLRMVKKTVNQDDPTVYHLFYADEEGSPGADITFFEYPGARRGRAGTGMVHTITFRVASEEALDFWESRLADAGIRDPAGRRAPRLRGPRRARARARRRRHAGCAARRAPSRHPRRARPPGLRLRPRLLRPLPRRAAPCSRARSASSRRAAPPGRHRGAVRGGLYAYDAPPASGPGVPGAGTVHHVAWASNIDEQEAWLAAVRAAGAHASGIIDRFWFRSIYFREPSGVLFEIATLGPGFSIDEDADHLGEALILPPAFEHLRAKIEPVLTPLPDPRAAWASS